MAAEVQLANWMFDGARADVAKVISGNPAFQLTHSFSLGSTTRPAAYNFGVIFANAKVRREARGKKVDDGRLICRRLSYKAVSTVAAL